MENVSVLARKLGVSRKSIYKGRDRPQGLLKTIELDLLPPDLAFQRAI